MSHPLSEIHESSPRSLALSEMGSEVDVDQSLNLNSFDQSEPRKSFDQSESRKFDQSEFDHVTYVANSIVNQSILKARLEVADDDVITDSNDVITDESSNDVISDSGTDSFSEQMVSRFIIRVQYCI